MSSRTAFPLLIFPYNGNGIEALDCLDETYRFIGFIDDTPEKQGVDPHGYPVMPRKMLAGFPDACLLAVPGGPKSFLFRRQVIDGLGISERRFATLIHPAARISPRASVGRNVLIMAGVVLTSNARVGDHVCILPNAVIHHDTVIGAWSMIGANVTIAGSVAIGESCYVGSGSSVINDVRIGNRTMVGLGSNVIRDVAAGSTVAGNPARVLG